MLWSLPAIGININLIIINNLYSTYCLLAYPRHHYYIHPLLHHSLTRLLLLDLRRPPSSILHSCHTPARCILKFGRLHWMFLVGYTSSSGSRTVWSLCSGSSCWASPRPIFMTCAALPWVRHAAISLRSTELGLLIIPLASTTMHFPKS